MPNIVIDSGPLIALFDGSDGFHERAITFVRDLRADMLTNLPVMTEVVYMLDFSHQAQRDLLHWAEQALIIDTKTVTDLPRIRALPDKYRDLPANFADASLWWRSVSAQRSRMWQASIRTFPSTVRGIASISVICSSKLVEQTSGA